MSALLHLAQMLLRREIKKILLKLNTDLEHKNTMGSRTQKHLSNETIQIEPISPC